MTAPAPPTPAQLAYTLPEGWITLPLPRDAPGAAAQAAALAAAHPELASSQPGVTRLLAGLARACTVLGVLDAHAMVTASAAGPRLVTLVVSASPLGAQPIADLAGDLAAADDGTGPRVQQVRLPAGPAVRAEWPPQRDPGMTGRLVTQYLIDIAGGRAVCALTFAAPAAGAAGELGPVFHQIASSVRCDAPGGPARAGSGSPR